MPPHRRHTALFPSPFWDGVSLREKHLSGASNFYKQEVPPDTELRNGPRIVARPCRMPNSTTIDNILVQSIFANMPMTIVTTATITKISIASGPFIQVTIVQPMPLDPVLSLIHISEPTRRTPISYAVF